MKDKMMAKREMLKELKKAMMDDDDVGMAEKLEGMKKVTVASDTKEGLEEGLDKAQEILKKRKAMMEDDSAADMEEDEDDVEEKLEMMKKMMGEE